MPYVSGTFVPGDAVRFDVDIWKYYNSEDNC